MEMHREVVGRLLAETHTIVTEAFWNCGYSVRKVVHK